MLRAHYIVLFALLTGCVIPDEESIPASRPEPTDLIVPRMAEPFFDGTVNDHEWEGTLRTGGEFVIENSTLSAGRYPFTMWMGLNDTGFYMAVKFENMTPNPYNEPQRWHPEVLRMFFTPGREGPLTQPSFFVSASNFPGQGSVTDSGYWDGSSWKLDDFPNRGKANYSEEGKPRGATLAVGGAHEGTVSWEIYFPHDPPNPDRNAFDLTRGGVFRMALGFVRADGSSDHDDAPHDDWPGEGYSPLDHYDPVGWVTLYISR